MKEHEIIQAILHEDLASFIQAVAPMVSPGEPFMPNWHIEAIAHHLMLCEQGVIKRLIITMPPRYLKSVSASVAFPAWAIGRDPRRKILTVNYAEGLAVEHSNSFRKVVESEWYRSAFPNAAISPRKNTQTEVHFAEGGCRFATTTGGTLTGRGGDIAILDDPHKADEAMSESVRRGVVEWFRTTLVTRLNDKRTGVIIVVMQRLHEDDLVGELLRQGGWVTQRETRGKFWTS
jgi:hypothetical protein